MPSAMPSQTRSRRALVVEDDITSRKILVKMLQAAGWEVDESGDAEDGIQRLQMHSYLLAFVDWNLPKGNGLDFIRCARKTPSQSGMKILMITGEIDMEHITSALKAGADEYLMKPHTHEMVQIKLRMMGL
jgi:two-component system, chemotaxis family, chemotaxis protein CheY